MSTATGRSKSISPRTPGSERISSGLRQSPSTIATRFGSASSALPCVATTGSLSTYTTRASGAWRSATSCTFSCAGRPEPRSRNWVTPCSQR